MGTTSELNKERALRLTEIRRALQLADGLRFADDLTPAQKSELEKASVDLRRDERVIIEMIGKDVASAIKESSASLEELAARVRERSRRLSKTARGTDRVTKAIMKVVAAAERANKL